MSVTSGGRPARRTVVAVPEPGHGLNAAELDRLATTLRHRAAPVRFALAETVSEREAIFRLRHDVVLERRWTEPKAMPDGLERDADDDHACFVAGWGSSPAPAWSSRRRAGSYRWSGSST